MKLWDHNLRLRIISAVVLIGILVALFYIGTFAIKSFILLVTFALQFEAKDLFFVQHNKKTKLILFSLAVFTTLLGLEFSFHLTSMLMMIAIITAIFSSLRHFPEFEAADIFSFLTQFLMYVAYTVWLPSYCYLIANTQHGLFWFSFLLAITLGTDTIAYFVGKKWGKTPLLPQISPKKTVEGSIAGLIGAVVIGVAFYFFGTYVGQKSFVFLFVGAFLGSIFSQAGDLFESLLKRQANVKDSSHLIPGHGGILDRIDGILFGGPIIYWLVIIYDSMV